MGLKGQLEDLPLLDILQVIAFSKKTGSLQIEGSPGNGAILFKAGRVVCSYSSSTLDHLRQIATADTKNPREDLFQAQVETSLRELMALREGEFNFELTEELPSTVEGVDISSYICGEGVNPEQLLLEVVTDADADRRDTADLIESASQTGQADEAVDESTPAPVSNVGSTEEVGVRTDPASLCTVVFVDDEPLIAEVVGKELQSGGYEVFTAQSPGEGITKAKEQSGAGKRVLVVVDLKMPTSSGKSFFGGFELVRRLRKNGMELPVLLMAETLSSKARKRALELNIRKVAYKPSLTKIDPEVYSADLRSFASMLLRQLDVMASEESPPAATDGPGVNPDNGSILTEFLGSMTEQLVSPSRSTDISRMVLQVASRYMERGALFLVKEHQACGLAGFGIRPDEDESSALARKLTVEIDETAPFANVIGTRKALRYGPDLDPLQTPLYSYIGRGKARECALVPMLNNGEVLTILYGDNAVTGRNLAKLRGLELFITQAGMVLEVTWLQRKLSSLDSKLTEKIPQ